MQGWLVIGHEVRSFRPCGAQQELWLMGNSPALEELKAEYAAAFGDAEPYASLFVSISGRRVPAPRDGFGADYEGGVIVDRLLQVRPQIDCSL